MFDWNAAKRGAVVMLAVICSIPAFASTAWLKLTPPNSPPGLAAMAMAYDPISKKVVSFGGYDATSYTNDTWLWDGVSWTLVIPANSPSPRAASAITYDRLSGELILFGGYNGTQYLGDTWIWNGLTETWTQATPKHVPTAVTLPMLFTDPVEGHAEMFGGFDGNFYQDITWRWTGGDWLQLHPATVPYARGAAVVANDYANKTVVMFGGLSDLNPVNTWTWDGTNWTLQNPSTQPPWTYYSGAAFEPTLNEVIVFGGFGLGTTTWAWTGSNWTTVPMVKSPPALQSLGMAYDSDNKQLVIFGGQVGNNFPDATYELLKR